MHYLANLLHRILTFSGIVVWQSADDQESTVRRSTGNPVVKQVTDLRTGIVEHIDPDRFPTTIHILAFLAIGILTYLADPLSATATLAALPVLVRVPRWPWSQVGTDSNGNAQYAPRFMTINPDEIEFFESRDRGELDPDARKPNLSATVIHLKSGEVLVTSMFDDEFIHFLQMTQRMGHATYDGRDKEMQSRIRNLRSEMRDGTYYQPADFDAKPDTDQDGRQLTSPADRVGPAPECQLCDETVEDGQDVRYHDGQFICLECAEEAGLVEA